MALVTETGYAFFVGTGSEALPALTATNVRFFPTDIPNRAAAEAYLRGHPDAVTYAVTDVSNIQVTDTTSGGSDGEVIAEDYNPGTVQTPAAGTDMTGQAFNTSTVILN